MSLNILWFEFDLNKRLFSLSLTQIYQVNIKDGLSSIRIHFEFDLNLQFKSIVQICDSELCFEFMTH